MKERDCERVQLQAKVVYPAPTLPDGPPRVPAYHCSRGMICNAYDRPACRILTPSPRAGQEKGSGQDHRARAHARAV